MNNTKYPFTETGFLQLLHQLDLLSPAELQMKINLLLQDIKSWVIAHFDFTAEQIAYLHDLDSQTPEFIPILSIKNKYCL